MERTNKNNYVRKGIYHNIQDFLSLVELNHTKKDLTIWDGDEIKLGSDRYKTFKIKGCKCTRCGIEGIFFAKERPYTKLPPKIISYHLNLYALREDGTEVLMTKDHIHPKSKGGKDSLDNYEPMCQDCNSRKEDAITIPFSEFLRILKPFDRIRIGVSGGDYPFEKIFFEAKKQEIIDSVRDYKMDVTYSIMFNSRVQPHLEDVLYIHEMKMKLDYENKTK